MRRGIVAGFVASATIGAAFVAGTIVVADPSEGGDLVVLQDVPDDVRAELDVTWSRFLDRFAARRACFGDVSIRLVAHVDGGDARYLADRAVIEIEIPTTPARFRESLAHELAHHVERTCPEFADLRAVLHPLLGGPGRPWSQGRVWRETPAELWAEAVVQLVNGERVLHGAEMPLDPVVLDRIESWAQGGDAGPRR